MRSIQECRFERVRREEYMSQKETENGWTAIRFLRVWQGPEHIPWHAPHKREKWEAEVAGRDREM